MHRIAGHVASLEPGAVDPVQAQVVAAARAVAAGQALVCYPESGALLLVDQDYDEDDVVLGDVDAIPPEGSVGEPPAHVLSAGVLVDEPTFVDQPGDFDEWETEFRSGSERCDGVPLPRAAEMADEPGVRVPRRLPAGVESLPGGAELAGVLESAQLGEIGAYELVEFVAACQRVASAMDALQASAVRELSHRVEMRPAEGVRSESMTPGRITGLEVGARLMTGDDQAGRLVSRAMLICEQLPDTYARWRSGKLSTERVDVMVAKLAGVDAELAREVEARVLPGAANRTPASLRRQITRLLHKLAPKSADKRHKEKKTERFARITPAPDGMAWLEAYLPAQDAAAIKAALDAGAATLKRRDDAGSSEGAAPRRTAGNRRADVLAALAWAALSTGRVGGCECDGGLGLSSVRGRPVTVNVTVSLETLLGENDEPGELAGYGPITAETARRLAADGTWRRIVTDPLSGAVLDVGRTRYTPPRDLADHVLARDQRCRWPTCDRPATGVGIHLDHTIAFEDGGTTSHANLGPFCGKNHVDKHQAGWTVAQPEPGRFVFTSPTGHVYTTELEPVGEGP